MCLTAKKFSSAASRQENDFGERSELRENDFGERSKLQENEHKPCNVRLARPQNILPCGALAKKKHNTNKTYIIQTDLCSLKFIKYPKFFPCGTLAKIEQADRIYII